MYQYDPLYATITRYLVCVKLRNFHYSVILITGLAILHIFALMDKITAIDTMNEFGAQREPFLFIIDYKMQNNHVYSLASKPDDIQFAMRGESTPHIADKAGLITIAGDINFEAYNHAFNTVQNHIKRGDTFLTNLTGSVAIHSNKSLQELFTIAHAKYKLLFRDEFLVFSPECFIEIIDGKIATYPMKGTIDASELNAGETVLNNKKEKAEHATIVDLLRNDLSIVAENVRVEKYRYIDRIKTNRNELLQVSSKITGTLQNDYRSKLGNIIFSLLPAGSICGAPKPKTLDIIDLVEIHNRGFYTGVFGVFDGKDLDSAVMIRFIEKQNNTLIYKSGGGITGMSDLETEFNEFKSKVYVPIG